MPAQQVDQAKAAIDGTLGIGTVTSPFWLPMVERGLGVVLAIGGLWLLYYRIRIAQREWREGENKPPADE